MDELPTLILKLPNFAYYEEPCDKATEIKFDLYKELFGSRVELDVFKHVLCGIHSGFPLCCILNYVSDLFILRAGLFGKKYYIFDDSDLGITFDDDLGDFAIDGFQFYPCPKCIDLFLHGELKLERFRFKKCYCNVGFKNMKRCA